MASHAFLQEDTELKHFRLYCFLLTAIVFLCPVFSRAAENNDSGLSEMEWTWEENSIASFQGIVSLDNLPSGKLLLKLSFTTDPKGTDPGEIVFHTVNGKKLTLRKQKAEYTIDHGDENILEFIGNWRTPEDVFFTRINIVFQICSEDGDAVYSEQKLTVSRSTAEMLEKDDGKIRLKTDLSAWTLRIGIGAAVIWILALLRIFINNKSTRKGR